MNTERNPALIPQKDEWNATANGDYLWSSVNFGEAVTEVMTPLTWSVIRFTRAGYAYDVNPVYPFWSGVVAMLAGFLVSLVWVAPGPKPALSPENGIVVDR